MPSLRHDGLVELIRQHPPTAVDLARRTGAYQIPDNVTAKLGSENATDLSPVYTKKHARNPALKPESKQYTADSVVVVSDTGTGDRLLAIVTEPQGSEDKDKSYSWPVYVTTARKANECPEAALVVLCWDPDQARKCRARIRVGPPGFDLDPPVLDRASAGDLGAAPPYTVLAYAGMDAIDLTTEDGQHLVLSAAKATAANSFDRAKLATFILGIAPDDASRAQLRSKMSEFAYKDAFVESWEQQGLAKGLAKGLEQGRIQEKAADLLKVMDARELKPTKDQRKQVMASTDLVELSTWFDRALTAETSDDIFHS